MGTMDEYEYRQGSEQELAADMDARWFKKLRKVVELEIFNILTSNEYCLTHTCPLGEDSEPVECPYCHTQQILELCFRKFI